MVGVRSPTPEDSMKAIRLAVLVPLFWFKVPVVLALFMLARAIRAAGHGLAAVYG